MSPADEAGGETVFFFASLGVADAGELFWVWPLLVLL